MHPATMTLLFLWSDKYFRILCSVGVLTVQVFTIINSASFSLRVSVKPLSFNKWAMNNESAWLCEHPYVFMKNFIV